MKKIFLLAFILLAVASGCQKNSTQTTPSNNLTPSSVPKTSSTPASPAPMTVAKFTMPIKDALTRVTKKPFGIYITPQTSPVSPEKFKGYHTGTDFETFEDEQNIEVAIYAICDGKLVSKRSATGYGGVAIQSCIIDGENITVLYGHLKLSSVTLKIGDEITIEQQIGILGKGYSTETDGERKHLHLSIHKGTAQILLGYTQNKADLVNWLNVENYLR